MCIPDFTENRILNLMQITYSPHLYHLISSPDDLVLKRFVVEVTGSSKLAYQHSMRLYLHISMYIPAILPLYVRLWSDLEMKIEDTYGKLKRLAQTYKYFGRYSLHVLSGMFNFSNR